VSLYGVVSFITSTWEQSNVFSDPVTGPVWPRERVEL